MQRHVMERARSEHAVGGHLLDADGKGGKVDAVRMKKSSWWWIGWTQMR